MALMARVSQTIHGSGLIAATTTSGGPGVVRPFSLWLTPVGSSAASGMLIARYDRIHSDHLL